ncbi:MAG: nitrous oxide reductase family maturation protein NosD, partial [Nitrosopumilaceae archaeon]
MSRNGPRCGTEFETSIDEHQCSFDSIYNVKKQIDSSYGKYLVSGIFVALALLIPSMINDAYASIPISSCETLNIPGETYILTNDLTSTGTCFTITARGITLDGNGHTLTGPGSQFGVKVNEYATGVTVMNMNISGFNTGIYVTASDASVIANTITNMGWSGIMVSNSCGVTISENTIHSTVAGIVAKYSTGIMIDKNNVDGNSQNGIRVTNVDGIIITDNSAITPGARGIIVQHSNDGFLVDNISSGNEAILLFNSHNNTLVNNTIESCSDCNSLYGIGVTGIMIWESNGNALIKNNIDSTHLWGVNLLDSNENTISGNLISNHQKEIASNAVGIQLGNSHYNTFNYNTISNNERPYSISASSNNQIYNNNFISNFNSGLIYENSENNVFNLDLPVGGNYWDNFDEASEGCEDINNDFVCDSAFVDTDSPYIHTTDAFAWSTPDDWLVNSPEILNIDSLDIPEAAFCPGAEPEIPVCEEPEVLDPETNTCVVPQPDVPVCEEPEVLDPETNTCVV